MGERFLPVRANRRPAVGTYAGEGGRFRPFALDVLRIEDGTVAEIITFDELLAWIGGGACLGRPLTAGDVAGVAVFPASDRAAGMMGTIVDVTGGAVGD